MVTSWQYNPFKYLFPHNQHGMRFIPSPWEPYIDEETKHNIPWFMLHRFPIVQTILILSIGGFLIGLFAGIASLVALAIGMLWFLHWNMLRAWKQSGNWSVRLHRAPTLVSEGKPWEPVFIVANNGNSTISCLVLRMHTDGSQTVMQTKVVEHLEPGEERRVTFSFLANKGPGAFSCHSISATVTDNFGLCSFSVAVEMKIPYRVNLIPLTFPPPKFKQARESLQLGFSETQRSGASNSILGLREFRPGDSIRFIDWKKTVQIDQLIVRDTERLAATEATIICDDGVFASMEDESISSSATVRQLVAGVAASLERGMVRFGLTTSQFTLSPEAGGRHLYTVLEAIEHLSLKSQESFMKVLTDAIAPLPPLSAIIVVCHSVSLALPELEELALVLEDRQIESIALVIDSQAYYNHIRRQAQFDPMHMRVLVEMEQKLRKMGPYGVLSQQLSALFNRAYLIGPFDHVSTLMTEVGY